MLAIGTFFIRLLTICVKLLTAGEYQQNSCSFGDVTCIPCKERLPSCHGLSDGNHPIPWSFWSQDYITCYWNRTISVGHCEKGIFDPNRRVCILEIPTGKCVLRMVL